MLVACGPLIFVRQLAGWQLISASDSRAMSAHFGVQQLFLATTVVACFCYLTRIPYLLELEPVLDASVYRPAMWILVPAWLITTPMVVLYFRLTSRWPFYLWSLVGFSAMFFCCSTSLYRIWGEFAPATACASAFIVVALGFRTLRYSGAFLSRNVSVNSTSTGCHETIRDTATQRRMVDRFSRDRQCVLQLTAFVVTFTIITCAIANTVLAWRQHIDLEQRERAIALSQRGGKVVFRARKAYSLTLDINADDEQFERFYTGCDDILHLSLEKTKISNSTIAKLGKFKKLISLNLNGTKISDECVDALCALTGLYHLEIAETFITLDGRRRLLQSLNQLGDLNVSGLGVMDDELIELPYYKLHTVKLRDNFITDVGMKQFLADCTKRGQGLQRGSYVMYDLDLYGTQVSGAYLSGGGYVIARLVLGGPQVTDEAIARAASNFSVGVHLEILDTMLTDDSLPDIFRIFKQGSLEIGNCLISDQGLAEVAGSLPALDLQLGLCGKQFTGSCFKSWESKIKCLSMRGSSVSDETLEDVASQEFLCCLSLANTNISDRGLFHVKKLKNLIWIDLSNTHVTVTALIDFLPKGSQINLARDQFTAEELQILGGQFQISIDDPIPWE
jgi:hypothetical protein